MVANSQIAETHLLCVQMGSDMIKQNSEYNEIGTCKLVNKSELH